MRSMNDIIKDQQSNTQDVLAWCNSIYDSKFRSYFTESRALFERMDSKVRPISDAELEWILIELPLILFSVSEELNSLRLSVEVIKLQNKEQKRLFSSMTKDEREANNADSILDEGELMKLAYAHLIKRVENEVSASRELIMGAKKIWEGRRSTEQSNPVGEVLSPSSNIPDYDPHSTGSKMYIK